MPVVNGITVVPDPVAQIDVAALFGELKINGQMAVSEQKVIVVFVFQHVFAISNEPLVCFTQKYFVGLAGLDAAFAAEVICQPDACSRWQDAEQPLTDRVAKNFLDEFIPMIAGAQSIAMANQKALAL